MPPQCRTFAEPAPLNFHRTSAETRFKNSRSDATLAAMELNGAPVTLDALKALALTNYGHFTSMLVDDHRVRGLSLHLRRLARDCRLLFDVELDTDRVRHFVRHALADAGQPTVARVTVYDPMLEMGSIGADADPHILVTTRAASAGEPAPWRLQAVSYQR